MAAPIERFIVSEVLAKTIENVFHDRNYSSNRLCVTKRTKGLENGDFFVPKFCFCLENEELLAVLDDLKQALIEETQQCPVRIRDVKLGSYDAFEIFVDRQGLYSACIERVCCEGDQYGKVSTSQGKMVLLDLVCRSELSTHKEVVTLDDLRAIVLSQHIQLLLESQGYQVSVIFDSDHHPKYDAVANQLNLNLSRHISYSLNIDDIHVYTDRTSEDRLGFRRACYSYKHTDIDKSDINWTVDADKTHDEIGISASAVTANLLSSTCSHHRKNNPNLATSDKTSYEFNMKHFLGEKGYITGKNGFDKNLHFCQVTSEGSPSAELKHAVALDKIMQAYSGSVLLHIVHQNQAFQLQKVHLVLEGISQQSDKFLQFHFVHGPVTHRTDSLKISDLTSEDYFRLRGKQMREAAVMKYGSAVSGDGWENTIQSVTSAGIKFELLSSVARNSLKLDFSNTQDASISDSRTGSFVMYNCARLATLLLHFQQAVEKGLYPPLPKIAEVDFSTLKGEAEWSLMFNYVYMYPEIVSQAVEDLQPKHGILSKLSTHKICVFLSDLSRSLSSYYSRVHVLGENRPHLLQTMYARLYLLKSVHQIMINGLGLIGISALSQL